MFPSLSIPASSCAHAGLLRRHNSSPGADAGVLRVQDLELDPAARQVLQSGMKLELTDIEFGLLEALMLSPGKVVNRDELSERVLGRKFDPFDRSLDMHVSRLRRKLAQEDQVKTIRGWVPAGDQSELRGNGGVMRSLFFKIFIIFWIAQSLIFVISTALIINRRIPRPVFLSPIFDDLRTDSVNAVDLFEEKGCSGLMEYARTRRYTIDLKDETGQDLCATGDVPKVNLQPASAEQLTGIEVGNYCLWSRGAVSASGKKYIYMIALSRSHEHHTWYSDLLHFAFPQLPVAIAIGGLTTFVLVLVFTRPVVGCAKRRGSWPMVTWPRA